MNKDEKDFINLVIERMPPLDEWLGKLNSNYKFKESEKKKSWQSAHQFGRRAKSFLNNLSKSSEKKSNAHQVIIELLNNLPNLLQESAEKGPEDSKVTNCGVVLLYRPPRETSKFFVDDVLVQNEKDPVFHTPNNLKWLKQKKQKAEGWTQKELLLEEATYSFQIPEAKTPSCNVTSIERSEFFEEVRRIFAENRVGVITVRLSQRGVGIPFDSTTYHFAGILFLLLDETKLECLPIITAKAIVLFRTMEVAIGTETRRLLNIIRGMALKETSRWEQKKQELNLVNYIRETWNAQEISIVRKSGPFAVLCPGLSHPLYSGYKYQQIWGKNEPKPGMKGYLGCALARETAYYVPDVRSFVLREDSIVPRNYYDPFLPNLYSQYTASYKCGIGFQGAINMAFHQPCALWEYQRKIINVLLEELGEFMYKILWDESEYTLMFNARKVLKTLKDRVLEYMEDTKPELYKQRRIEINQLYSKVAGQFISSRGESGPGQTKAQLTINEAVSQLQQQMPKISFVCEPFQNWQINMITEDFEKVLYNLLDNATEAVEDLAAGQVYVTMRETDWNYPDKDTKGVELVVADNGDMVDEDFVHRMFDRAESRKSSNREPENMGLGLLVVDQLCRDYGLFLEYRILKKGPYKKEFVVFFPQKEMVE